MLLQYSSLSLSSWGRTFRFFQSLLFSLFWTNFSLSEHFPKWYVLNWTQYSKPGNYWLSLKWAPDWVSSKLCFHCLFFLSTYIYDKLITHPCFPMNLSWVYWNLPFWNLICLFNCFGLRLLSKSRTSALQCHFPQLFYCASLTS